VKKTEAMRRPRLFILFFLFPLHSLFAQPVPLADERTGVYRGRNDPAIEFRIARKNDHLLLQILGQGRTELVLSAGGWYLIKGVRPAARLEFLKNDSGQISGCRVLQDEPSHTWKRIDSAASGPAAGAGLAVGSGLAGLTGDYQLTANPYRVFHIREKEGRLFALMGALPEQSLEPLGHKRFQFIREGYKYVLEFNLSNGRAVSLVNKGNVPISFVKIGSTLPHVSNRSNGFTRADTLQGMLGTLRNCYDVLFYHLDLTILTETRSIRGSNLIRWRTVLPFRRMQVDLYENLAIDSISYHGGRLDFTRDGNAVYITLPAMVAKGSVDELRIAYSGVPLQPDIEARKGGIFWLTNRDRSVWIESVTQGIGASAFWPCKDHLSDRPDSMRITITVPHGLSDISNGRLLSRTELPDHWTRFDWYVDYPIVTYNVVINIGDYTHFSDVYTRGNGETLPLNFYCMSYNLDTARRLFGDVGRMLTLYEQDFGPYPFPLDGFTVLESIYPMDHQGAVSVGSMRNPFNSDKYDGSIRTLMWHECGHEWWGNNVGCSDYADMWIHESFASYAEFLNQESVEGRAAALKELNKDNPDNKEPIIGVYNVNHFHEGDMYLKGARMLNTLRSVMQNDSGYFRILRGIQERFRYTPVRTEDIVAFFNTASGQDYTYFFDQYLRFPRIPVLVLSFQQDGDVLRVRYQWEADVAGFRMPIKVRLTKDSWGFIQPTTSEQTLELRGMSQKDFAVDTEEFYVAVKGL